MAYDILARPRPTDDFTPRPKPTPTHPNCQACGGPPGCVTEYPEHGIMIAHCYDCDLTYDLHDAEDGA